MYLKAKHAIYVSVENEREVGEGGGVKKPGGNQEPISSQFREISGIYFGKIDMQSRDYKRKNLCTQNVRVCAYVHMCIFMHPCIG